MTEFNNSKDKQSQVAKFINLNLLKGKVMEMQKKLVLQCPVNKKMRF